MSKRTRQCGSRPQADAKARRLMQLIHQRRLQAANSGSYHQSGEALPEKQQQSRHNAISDGLPFGLFTSDQ